MVLDWGNVLQFDNEKEYYETLGFLSKDEEYIRIYTESNDKAGAWARQGIMSLRNVSVDSLPEALMKAFETSADGRISETRYVRNLKENHNFTKEVDPTGSDFTKRLYKETLENAELYRKNADGYLGELEALDQDFREIVDGGKRHLLVFGDKFPLRYFFEEYGLSYRAAFSGCSTDTEPSAKTIAYLIDKVREEQIPVVFYLELSSPRVAEIIGEETGAEPMLFSTCHNVTRRQFDLGVTYLDLMRQNEDCLRKGLN